MAQSSPKDSVLSSDTPTSLPLSATVGRGEGWEQECWDPGRQEKGSWVVNCGPTDEGYLPKMENCQMSELVGKDSLLSTTCFD